MDQYIKLQSKEVFRHSRGMTILDDERFMDFATNIIIDIGKKESLNEYQVNEPLIRSVAFRVIPNNLSDQIYYLKGLVLCEKFFGWGCGSASPSIRVFNLIKNHHFIKKNIYIFDDLLNWIMDNKVNGYIPFGTMVAYQNCRSYEEMKAEEARLLLRQIKQGLHEKYLQKIKSKRLLVKKENHKKRKLDSIKRTKHYKGLVKKFMKLSKLKKYSLIFNDELKFPINLLPNSEWEEILRSNLEAREIKKLISIIPRNTSIFLKENIKPRLIKMKKLSIVSNG